MGSVVECPLMMQWVIGSIPHSGLTALFLVPASAPLQMYQRLCNKGYGMCYHVCGERVAHVVAAGFLSRYLSGPLPYV